jgi:hypothetical protein
VEENSPISEIQTILGLSERIIFVCSVSIKRIHVRETLTALRYASKLTRDYVNKENLMKPFGSAS